MFTALVASVVLAPGQISVMSYNIWVGGTRFQPLSQTIKVIEKAQVDVVGIQEPGDNLANIARGLGWNFSTRSSIITRYQILGDWSVTGNRWGGARLRTPEGYEFIVYNDHFTAYPYGPYEVRDKKATTVSQVEAVERAAGRVDQMNRVLADIGRRWNQRTPLVFTGDFNTPSHKDWTQATASRNFGLVMPWPVTVAAERAGFKDGYRELVPDPVKKPAFTWSPGYPVPNLEPNEVMDRIDFVLYRGPLVPLRAQVVGESGPHTDIAVDPWPSDHRAVVVRFRPRR